MTTQPIIDWSMIDLGPVVSAAALAIAAVLAWTARKFSQMTPTPPEPAIQMSGAAIISSESMMAVARAIEAMNVSQAARRADDEKARALGHKMAEAIDDLAEQVKELRTELARRR